MQGPQYQIRRIRCKSPTTRVKKFQRKGVLIRARRGCGCSSVLLVSVYLPFTASHFVAENISPRFTLFLTVSDQEVDTNMKNLTESTALRLSDAVRLTATQDGAVLLDVKEGSCFRINPVGALIWNQLGQGIALNTIAQHIANTFSISSEQAKDDVEAFVQQLKQKHLVWDSGVSVVLYKPPRRVIDVVMGLWRSVRRGSRTITE